ncbi:MAG TPA: hypothetical protein VFT98_07275, partial [Myxococcota bacterium]|nr:hypothetical protein [Myxococcota bacterium]
MSDAKTQRHLSRGETVHRDRNSRDFGARSRGLSPPRSGRDRARRDPELRGHAHDRIVELGE